MADEQCEVLCLDLERAESLRAQRLSSVDAAQLAGQMKALSDPTRLMLATALASGEELCVCDLAWIADRAENLVSHHLRRLRSCGLVAGRRDGKMMMYSLTDRGYELLLPVLGSETKEVTR